MNVTTAGGCQAPPASIPEDDPAAGPSPVRGDSPAMSAGRVASRPTPVITAPSATSAGEQISSLSMLLPSGPQAALHPATQVEGTSMVTLSSRIASLSATRPQTAHIERACMAAGPTGRLGNPRRRVPGAEFVAQSQLASSSQESANELPAHASPRMQEILVTTLAEKARRET